MISLENLDDLCRFIFKDNGRMMNFTVNWTPSHPDENEIIVNKNSFEQRRWYVAKID